MLQFKAYFLLFAALFLSVTIGLVVSVWFWMQAVQQRDLANKATANESEARLQAELQSYMANIVAAKNGLANNDIAEAKRRLDASPERYRGWEFDHLKAGLDQSETVFQIHDLYVTDFELLTEANCVVSIAGDKKLKLWDIATGKIVHV